MGHQVLKSVSSVVRMIVGRVIVQRWMMARRIRDEKCSSDSFQVDPLCGAAVSPVQDDDECKAHAAER